VHAVASSIVQWHRPDRIASRGSLLSASSPAQQHTSGFAGQSKQKPA
jgi:hypothetical protein